MVCNLNSDIDLFSLNQFDLLIGKGVIHQQDYYESEDLDLKFLPGFLMKKQWFITEMQRVPRPAF
jgi:hypothetical protein